MRSVATIIKDSALLLRNNQDLNCILESIGDDTQVVMIGEATHGTHEFYRIRAEITRRLIQEKGFTIVSVEADWPDAQRINRFAKNLPGADKKAIDSLGDFERFPRWMWRNTVVLEFVEWLRHYNDSQRQKNMPMAGFFGLDLYSLNSSMKCVIDYLEKRDPEMTKNAKKLYACFDRFGGDSQVYGYKTGSGLSKSCEAEVLKVVKDLMEKKSEMSSSKDDDDSYFFAKMNAKVVKDAERYYRNMFTGVNTWNIRDKHMVETLANLINYYSNKLGTNAKAVVWAHNSHLGDASHTSMKARGEYNLGQLAREHFGMDKCFNIGFTTYNGTVTASHDWDEDPQFMLVNPGMEGSYEKLLHGAMIHMGQDFMNPAPYMLIFRSNNKKDPNKYLTKDDLRRELEHSRFERAIGVIYRPATEIFSHYFKACLPKQFDAVIHVETTLALCPLEIHPQWAKAQREHVPSAFPGLAHLKAADYELEGFFDPSRFKFGPDFVNEMYHKDIINKKSSA